MLRSTEKFLKVPRSDAFKNFSGFYDSAKCCKAIALLAKINTYRKIARRNISVDVTEIVRQTQILSQRLSIAQDYL
jgi:hypothetical protein